MKKLLKTGILFSLLIILSSCGEKSSNAKDDALAVNSKKSNKPSDIASANVLEFTPNGVLFVGDSYTGTIVAYETESTENATKGSAYNLKDFDIKIEKLLGVQSDEMIIKDLAVHPHTNEAYIAVSYISGDAYAPAIIIANQDGNLRLMDLASKNTKLN